MSLNEQEKKTWLDFGFFEIPYAVEKKYAKLKPDELLDRLIKSVSFTDRPDDKYFDVNIENQEDCTWLPRWIFNHYLDTVFSDFYERIYEVQVKPLEDRLDELERQFKNHRHDRSKSYTDKPVWG